MKVAHFSVPLAFLLAAQLPAWAGEGGIYRCGSDYLNDAVAAQLRGCTLVESSGVSVTVTGTRVLSQVPEPKPVRAADALPAVPANAALPPGALGAAQAVPVAPKISWRTDSAEQRLRDRDALSILQAELSKAEALLAERQRDLADPQRHASRLSELQSSVSRHLSDIAGLKREISRLPR